MNFKFRLGRVTVTSDDNYVTLNSRRRKFLYVIADASRVAFGVNFRRFTTGSRNDGYQQESYLRGWNARNRVELP